MSNLATFGKVVSEARKTKEMNQKQLAELVKRDDGESISPQYLNDIEHNRRTPAPEVIKQLAEVLQIDEDYLRYLANYWPEEFEGGRLTQQQFAKGLVAFRKQAAK